LGVFRALPVHQFVAVEAGCCVAVPVAVGFGVGFAVGFAFGFAFTCASGGLLGLPNIGESAGELMLKLICVFPLNPVALTLRPSVRPGELTEGV